MFTAYCPVCQKSRDYCEPGITFMCNNPQVHPKEPVKMVKVEPVKVVKD